LIDIYICSYKIPKNIKKGISFRRYCG